MKKIKFQAHRGLSTDYPENTLLAFNKVISAGYEIIELDPKMTSDDQCVFIHDPSIQRTGRKADGTSFDADQALLVEENTLAELRKFDFGIWKDQKFKGLKIPTLAEVIQLIEENNVIFKFDNVYETFPDFQRSLFLKELATCKHKSKIALTCSKIESIHEIIDSLPEVAIHYDGPIDQKMLESVKESAGERPLMFWIGYPNEYTSWNTLPKASIVLCEMIKQYGELGIWTISQLEEYERSVNDFKADAIETDGSLKPQMFQ